MTRSLSGLLLIVAICIVMLWSSQPRSQVAAQPGDKAQKWEYKLGDVRKANNLGEAEKEFNKLADDGWEFSGSVGQNPVFKRPKK